MFTTPLHLLFNCVLHSNSYCLVILLVFIRSSPALLLLAHKPFPPFSVQAKLFKMGIERLIVRFNGVTTGYDLTTPERRSYQLRSPEDWVTFRMSSVTRALEGLTLGPEKPPLVARHETNKRRWRARRSKQRRANNRRARRLSSPYDGRCDKERKDCSC